MKQAALTSMLERLNGNRQATRTLLKHFPGLVKSASELAGLKCPQSREDVLHFYEMTQDADLCHWFSLDILEGCKVLLESEDTNLDRIKNLVKLINY